ncbi:MAG: PrgI family protein [bacterium]|nr:PrgI family protein [bacterium]
MEQFVVPQFIDVEDKIFGPITTRQFIILLVAGLFLFLTYKLADFSLFIFGFILVGGIAVVLAFVRINGQPFHYFLLNIFQTMRRPGLRIWRKDYSKQELEELRLNTIVKIPEPAPVIPHISYSRLRDLSLVVNTGGYYKPE